MSFRLSKLISRAAPHSLLGSYVSLVRVTDDAPPPISEHVLEARVAQDEEDAETALEALMQHNVDSFIESHVLRFQLPSWFSSAIGGPGVGTGRDAPDAVDLDLEDIVESKNRCDPTDIRTESLRRSGKNHI